MVVVPGFKLVALEQEAQVQAELMILGGQHIPGRLRLCFGHTRAHARVPARWMRAHITHLTRKKCVMWDRTILSCPFRPRTQIPP